VAVQRHSVSRGIIIERVIEREGTTTPKNQYSISNPCHAHFG
jgi:hypothetical protein